MQALSAMQQPVPPPAKSVAAAFDPGAGAGIAPKMPSVIGTLAGEDAFPRVRPAPKVPSEDPGQGFAATSPDPVMNALAQQSNALTALVAHLTSSQDPLQDLHLTGGSGAASSTRGVQKRERLQSELANGQSQFFVQVMQQMHRRLNPARPVPASEEDLASSGISMLSYLERTGGYRQQRDLGTIMWILAHAVDSLIQNDVHMAREHIALLVCGLEQAAVDQGQWNLAFLISLSEEPPVQLYQDRISAMSQSGRPFAPLIPSTWCAIALSYLKEIEILTNRKAEVGSAKAKAVPKAVPVAADDSPSPKRRPRYPKKPKADPSQE